MDGTRRSIRSRRMTPIRNTLDKIENRNNKITRRPRNSNRDISSRATSKTSSRNLTLTRLNDRRESNRRNSSSTKSNNRDNRITLRGNEANSTNRRHGKSDTNANEKTRLVNEYKRSRRLSNTIILRNVPMVLRTSLSQLTNTGRLQAILQNSNSSDRRNRSAKGSNNRSPRTIRRLNKDVTTSVLMTIYRIHGRGHRADRRGNIRRTIRKDRRKTLLKIVNRTKLYELNGSTLTNMTRVMSRRSRGMRKRTSYLQRLINSIRRSRTNRNRGSVTSSSRQTILARLTINLVSRRTRRQIDSAIPSARSRTRKENRRRTSTSPTRRMMNDMARRRRMRINDHIIRYGTYSTPRQGTISTIILMIFIMMLVQRASHFYRFIFSPWFMGGTFSILPHLRATPTAIQRVKALYPCCRQCFRVLLMVF